MNTQPSPKFWRLPVLAACGLLLAACLPGCTIERSETGDVAHSETSDRQITVDGSSTVAPISMAIAEVFENAHPDVALKVNVSGTGGGFEQFALGKIDISNASRPIKPTEAAGAEENDVRYVEVLIATDGLTVVVHPANNWCSALTIEQLAKIWAKDSDIRIWSDIDPTWPAERIKLFGADAKSGTYDYFKEETVGKDVPMRTDYQPNTDDNVLVTGVAGDKFALGFIPFAYFAENSGKLKGVAIAPRGQGTSSAVAPTQEMIESGAYTPLARPLFIYANLESLRRPAVRDFVEFHLSDEGQKLVELKQYIQLNPQQLSASRNKLHQALLAVDAEMHSPGE